MQTDHSCRPRTKRGLAAVLFLALFVGISPVAAQGLLSGSIPNAVTGSREDAFAGAVIAGVQIKGNTTVSNQKIMRYLRTRKDRRLDPEVLQADKRRLITQCKLRDVRIYTHRQEAGVIVTFEVFERPTIRAVKFIGNRGASDKALLKESGLKVGDALNAYSIEESRRRIEEYYHGHGYPNASVVISEGKSPEAQNAVFYISEGPLQLISKIEFVGNTIASDGRLKTVIESRPTFFGFAFRGKLDETKLHRDVDMLTEYYRGLGFFRARIGRILEFDDAGKRATLRFVIDEGPRYVVRNVSVQGCEQFATLDLEQDLELHSGDFFDLAKMNIDVSTLRDTYGMHGFIFADIQADPRFLEQPGQLDLIYSVEEGDQFRVGEIHVHIAGEFPHTQERVILDRLSFRPGDIVDIRQVRASERRIKASQLFIVNPAEGNPPRIVIKPPDLTETESLARRRSTGTFRGQSPDENTERAVRELNLDVFATPLPR